MTGRVYLEEKIDKATAKVLDTVPVYVREWYTNLEASDMTASSRKIYIRGVKRFLTSINKNPMLVKPEEITHNAVAQYMVSISKRVVNGETQKTSDSYRYSIWSYLNNFLEFMTNRGYINENYMRYIKRPKNHDLDRINEHRVLLTEDDFREILYVITQEKRAMFRTRNMAIVMLFMFTGMRLSALTSIMLDDLDIENGILTIVDKGEKRHVYPLDDDVIGVLKVWLSIREDWINDENERHLFLSMQRKPISENEVHMTIKKYTEQALGKPLSPHKLRAGFCSILYNKTHDIEFVRRAVGHASVATTSRYIVTDGSERRKASKLLRDILH